MGISAARDVMQSAQSAPGICRERWLWQEQYSPEQMAHHPEAATTSQVIGDPFKWTPVVRPCCRPLHLAPPHLCVSTLLPASCLGSRIMRS